jgi:hypothetical protein
MIIRNEEINHDLFLFYNGIQASCANNLATDYQGQYDIAARRQNKYLGMGIKG